MKTQQEMQSLLHGMKMRIDLEQVLPAPAGWLVVNLQRNAWAPLYATGVCSVTYHDEEGENEPVREVLPLVWTGVQIALLTQDQDWGWDCWYSDEFSGNKLLHWTQALAFVADSKLDDYTGLEAYVKGCAYVTR